MCAPLAGLRDGRVLEWPLARARTLHENLHAVRALQYVSRSPLCHVEFHGNNSHIHACMYLQCVWTCALIPPLSHAIDWDHYGRLYLQGEENSKARKRRMPQCHCGRQLPFHSRGVKSH